MPKQVTCTYKLTAVLHFQPKRGVRAQECGSSTTRFFVRRRFRKERAKWGPRCCYGPPKKKSSQIFSFSCPFRTHFFSRLWRVNGRASLPPVGHPDCTHVPLARCQGAVSISLNAKCGSDLSSAKNPHPLLSKTCAPWTAAEGISMYNTENAPCFQCGQ